MSIIFFGTPAIALPFFDFLVQHYRPSCVLTRKDKPSGRHQQLQASPVKTAALKESIEVLSPPNLNDPEFLQTIAALKPQAGIVVAYGRIIPQELITLFPQGLYNIHFSLLPHLRGAAPMQWSLLRGDLQSGVSIFRITPGLDCGPLVAQQKIALSPQEDFFSLQQKLTNLGLTLLEQTLPKILDGSASAQDQQGDVTLAPTLQKSDAKIDWSQNAQTIDQKVRALIYMGAFAQLPSGQKLKILRGQVCQTLPDNALNPAQNGEIIALVKNQGLIVQCAQSALLILEVQPEGKKPMSAWSFLQGHALKTGSFLL